MSNYMLSLTHIICVIYRELGNWKFYNKRWYRPFLENQRSHVVIAFKRIRPSRRRFFAILIGIFCIAVTLSHYSPMKCCSGLSIIKMEIQDGKEGVFTVGRKIFYLEVPGGVVI